MLDANEISSTYFVVVGTETKTNTPFRSVGLPYIPALGTSSQERGSAMSITSAIYIKYELPSIDPHHTIKKTTPTSAIQAQVIHPAIISLCALLVAPPVRVALAVADEVLEDDDVVEVEVVEPCESSATPPGSADPGESEVDEGDSADVRLDGVVDAADTVALVSASGGGVVGTGGVVMRGTEAPFR